MVTEPTQRRVSSTNGGPARLFFHVPASPTPVLRRPGPLALRTRSRRAFAPETVDKRLLRRSPTSLVPFGGMAVFGGCWTGLASPEEKVPGRQPGPMVRPRSGHAPHRPPPGLAPANDRPQAPVAPGGLCPTRSPKNRRATTACPRRGGAPRCARGAAVWPRSLSLPPPSRSSSPSGTRSPPSPPRSTAPGAPRSRRKRAAPAGHARLRGSRKGPRRRGGTGPSRLRPAGASKKEKNKERRPDGLGLRSRARDPGTSPVLSLSRWVGPRGGSPRCRISGKPTKKPIQRSRPKCISSWWGSAVNGSIARSP